MRATITTHHDAHEVRARPVVLDLGEGIGALVVHTDPDLLGTEVEISPSGHDGDRQHKEVLQRAIGGKTTTVLVYDSLPEGEYTLWVGDEPGPAASAWTAARSPSSTGAASPCLSRSSEGRRSEALAGRGLGARPAGDLRSRAAPARTARRRRARGP